LSVLLAFLLIVTSINVNPNIAYAAKKKAIKLNYTEYTLAKGKTVKLKASTTKNASVVWKSNNNSIATVSSKGTVKALKDGVTVIYLGENIDKDKLLHFTEYDTDHEKESHVIKHNDHQHGDFDPHIWLDPVLAQDCVKLICSTLENKDTEHTEIYKDNAEKYISKLKKLDKDIIEQLADIQLKPFFTQHDAFSYFNKRYSLKCVGVLEVVPDSDVTPKHLRDLLRQIREQDVVAIMVPSRGNTRMVKQLASDGRIKIGTLETLGVLDEGELNADTYERLMRKNIREILSTLK